MPDLTAKIRINLQSGEIEVQGSEEFVERQLESLEDLLDLMGRTVASDVQQGATDPPQNGTEPKDNGAASQTIEVPDSYGEWEHGFPRSINDTDRALAAAYYVQAHSASNEFKTSEVTKLLRDSGHKLANTSETLRRLAERKYAFPVRKQGVISYYRVSRDGRDYLLSIRNRS